MYIFNDDNIASVKSPILEAIDIYKYTMQALYRTERSVHKAVRCGELITTVLLVMFRCDDVQHGTFCVSVVHRVPILLCVQVVFAY